MGEAVWSEFSFFRKISVITVIKKQEKNFYKCTSTLFRQIVSKEDDLNPEPNSHFRRHNIHVYFFSTDRSDPYRSFKIVVVELQFLPTITQQLISIEYTVYFSLLDCHSHTGFDDG
jgi:hypothetical protein